MYWPTHTSYFSIASFISSDMNMKTAIALDIIRKHFNNLKFKGENINLIAVSGYGDFITFDELCQAI